MSKNTNMNTKNMTMNTNKNTDTNTNRNAVTQFLKYTYKKHIKLPDDNCCTHGIEYALERQDSQYKESVKTKTSV